MRIPALRIALALTGALVSMPLAADEQATIYTRNAQGRIASVTNAEGPIRYTYFPDGLIEAVEYPNGTKDTYKHEDILAARAAVDATHAESSHSDSSPRRLDASHRGFVFTSSEPQVADLAANSNRFLFTGHYFDVETGLYYAKARFYDPEVGRFTSQDSYLGELNDPPSLHRYFYGNANPTRYIDPTGHSGVHALGAVEQFKREQAEQAKRAQECPYGCISPVEGNAARGAAYYAGETLLEAASPAPLGLSDPNVSITTPLSQPGQVGADYEAFKSRYGRGAQALEGAAVMKYAPGKFGKTLGAVMILGAVLFGGQPEVSGTQLEEGALGPDASSRDPLPREKEASIRAHQAGDPGALRSSTADGRLPSTGVERFDELAVGTQQYQRWTGNLERRGFDVAEESLRTGTAAEITGRQVTVDPEQFRYVDLLHESRHVRQIELAPKGLDPATRRPLAIFERGAYEYEQRLGQKSGFNQDYMSFVRERIGEVWNKGIRQEFAKSPSFKQLFKELWR